MKSTKIGLRLLFSDWINRYRLFWITNSRTNRCCWQIVACHRFYSICLTIYHSKIRINLHLVCEPLEENFRLRKLLIFEQRIQISTVKFNQSDNNQPKCCWKKRSIFQMLALSRWCQHLRNLVFFFSCWQHCLISNDEILRVGILMKR